MGIWTKVLKIQNKNMQKQNQQEDLTPMRVFKSDSVIDVKCS